LRDQPIEEFAVNSIVGVNTGTRDLGVKPIGGNALDPAVALDEHAAEHELASLPQPLTQSAAQSDLMGLVAALNERMGMLTTQVSETSIKHNQDRIKDAMTELKAALDKAAQQAESARHKRSGWFSSICNAISHVFEAIGKFIGAVVGTVADFVVDTITQPIDIIKGLINGENFQKLLENEFHDMTTNGSVAHTVDQCCQALTNFLGDLTNFANVMIGAMEAGLRGENVEDMLKGECKELLHSLKRNVINNPAVMKVVGVVLKVLAVAAMALGTVSFGVGAIVAVGLLALAELNERTGLATKVFGKEAGAWLSLGLRLAATVASMVCLGGGGNSNGVIESLTEVGALIQGVSAVSVAYDRYEALNKQADRSDNEASIQDILFRMQRLQRSTDYLIEALEQQTQSWSRDRGVASQAAQTTAATPQAALMPA
jgi:hypothetical protein